MGSYLVERAGLTRLVVDNNGSDESYSGVGPLAAEALARCLDLRCLALSRITWAALDSLTAFVILFHLPDL